jgi:hypothetical protein
MDYPTLPEVDAATHTQLARWYRFLRSPGHSAVGSLAFADVLIIESDVMRRICHRFEQLGGMTPAISKEIDG